MNKKSFSGLHTTILPKTHTVCVLCFFVLFLELPIVICSNTLFFNVSIFMAFWARLNVLSGKIIFFQLIFLLGLKVCEPK